MIDDNKMDAQLRTDIQSALRAMGAQAPILVSRVRTDKLYEIFVFTCAIRALQEIGAAIEARDSRDRRTSTLVFRLGPGLIYNPTSSPGFIYVNYGGKEYELQNGLRVCGRSKVRHELDVCLIMRRETHRCRSAGIDPSGSKVRFLAECKYYGDKLPLHLGREFVGLCAEFAMRAKVIVSNKDSDDIHTLITKHKGTENFNLTPLEPDGVDMFVRWIANEFRQVLK